MPVRRRQFTQPVAGRITSLMQSKRRCLPLEAYFYRTSNLNRILLLLAIYFAAGALAADCNGGTAAANCENANCEMVGTTQICTSCQAGYVPINGKCTAVASAANCKKTAGGDLDSTDKTCGKCLSTTFMYKGRCYETTAPPGSVMWGGGPVLCRWAPRLRGGPKSHE